MRKILVLWGMLLFTVQVNAQTAGFSQVKNVAALQQAMVKNYSNNKTITADFSQSKNMKLLSEVLKSKGKFYFQQPEKMRIEYTSPYQYLVVYNNGMMLVKDESKTNKINTRSSKFMQSLNRITIDCMSGRVFDNKDFKTSASENSKSYLLDMVPVDAAMKKMFKDIDVLLDKNNLAVTKIVMTEVGGDVTEMNFQNTKNNLTLNEGLFKVK